MAESPRNRPSRRPKQYPEGACTGRCFPPSSVGTVAGGLGRGGRQVLTHPRGETEALYWPTAPAKVRAALRDAGGAVAALRRATLPLRPGHSAPLQPWPLL